MHGWGNVARVGCDEPLKYKVPFPTLNSQENAAAKILHHQLAWNAGRGACRTNGKENRVRHYGVSVDRVQLGPIRTIYRVLTELLIRVVLASGHRLAEEGEALVELQVSRHMRDFKSRLRKGRPKLLYQQP